MGGDSARVLMAVVTGARGLKGEVKLKSFTEDPEAVFAYGPLSDEAGTQRFSGRCTGRGKGQVFARIDGVSGRDAAEALKGVRLYAAREDLPEPAEDEFYHADLIGLTAETPEGAVLGTVQAVHDFGAGASLEIGGGPAGAAPGGRIPGGSIPGESIIVPLTRAAVTEVDIAGGRLVAARPEDIVAGAEDEAGSEPETGAGNEAEAGAGAGSKAESGD
ncbi:MAG: ribosome maturation factor RimM [Rhodospirillales bacterium]